MSVKITVNFTERTNTEIVTGKPPRLGKKNMRLLSERLACLGIMEAQSRAPFNPLIPYRRDVRGVSVGTLYLALVMMRAASLSDSCAPDSCSDTSQGGTLSFPLRGPRDLLINNQILLLISKYYIEY